MNRKPDPLADHLLTIREVAGYCQVDEKTIRRWIEAGNLSAFKLGRLSDHEGRLLLNFWHPSAKPN